MSEEYLPIIKYKSHLKPYWTPKLTRLSKEDKRLMKEWKAAGSLRNDDSDIWRRYRNAKHTYQRVHRQRKNAFNQEGKRYKNLRKLEN